MRIVIVGHDDVYVYEYDPAIINFVNVNAVSLKDVTQLSLEMEEPPSALKASMIA